jgi:hypothetical protein
MQLLRIGGMKLVSDLLIMSPIIKSCRAVASDGTDDDTQARTRALR